MGLKSISVLSLMSMCFVTMIPCLSHGTVKIHFFCNVAKMISWGEKFHYNISFHISRYFKISSSNVTLRYLLIALLLWAKNGFKLIKYQMTKTKMTFWQLILLFYFL